MASGVVDIKIRFLPVARLLMGKGFQRRLVKEFNRAAFIVGSSTAAKMRKTVGAGVDPENSQFTQQLKGSTKTLFDEGRLFKAFTWRIIKGSSGLVSAIHIGVLRGSPVANVARIVHGGAKIRVTRRMQILFGVLSAISRGKDRKTTSPRAEELRSRAGSANFLPLREGQELIIPPRPFAAITFADPDVRARAEREFAKALRRAVIPK